jgi:hypothetical protein
MAAYGCLVALDEAAVKYRSQQVGEEGFYAQSNAILVNLAEIAEETHRFGVVMPLAIENGYKKQLKKLEQEMLRPAFSSTFWKWYNWWGDYIKALSPDEVTHVYQLATMHLPQLARFRPDGDWLNHRADRSILL